MGASTRYRVSAPPKEGWNYYSRAGLFIPRGSYLVIEVTDEAEDPAPLQAHSSASRPVGLAEDGTIRIGSARFKEITGDLTVSVQADVAQIDTKKARIAELEEEVASLKAKLAKFEGKGQQEEAPSESPTPESRAGKRR